MLQRFQIIETLQAAAAVLEGHFVLKAGHHAPAYVNKDYVFLDPKDMSKLCEDLALRVIQADIRPEVVVGPVMGGVIMSQWLAYHLTPGFKKGILAVYAEKVPRTDDPTKFDFVFNRGYGQFVAGKRVLIVEDVLTTGSSVKQVIDLVRKTEGEVVGVAALVNRSGGDVTAESLGVPGLVSELEVSLDKWDADKCPLCREGVKISGTVGHWKKFLDENPHMRHLAPSNYQPPA